MQKAWNSEPAAQLVGEEGDRKASRRRSFRDAKIQRLENMASEIGVGLAVLATAGQRLRPEAEQRRAEEERQRRDGQLASSTSRIAEPRDLAILTELDELDELDRLRRLIVMLATEMPAEPTPRLSTFLAWAKEHLAKREAPFSAQAI